MKAAILTRVRLASAMRRLYLPHAVRQMARPDRMIGPHEVRAAVERRLQEAEVEMKCLHCQGELVRASAPLHVDRDGCHLVLDRVPAWVCRQCGKPLFDEREVDAIQTLVRTIEENARKIAAAG